MTFPTAPLREGCRLIMAFVLAAGCNAGVVRATGDDPERISTLELRSVPGISAYQAIQRLRPQFLRDRSTLGGIAPPNPSSGTEAIVVYVDGSRMGGTESLNSIPVDEVAEIRRLSPGQAMQKYGSRQRGTVIDVIRHTGS